MTAPRDRPTGRGGGCLRVVPVLLTLALAGCSHADAQSSQALPQAGRYAIATPGPQILRTPEASDTHYQVVAAGTPVRVTLGSTVVVMTVSGPELRIPDGLPASHAPGRLTVAVSPERGSQPLPVDSFLALDEARNPIPLSADDGSSPAGAGSSSNGNGNGAVLHLSAEFASGHTTLTWQPTGHPLVTWDFVVEID